jgi:hypothetical protein
MLRSSRNDPDFPSVLEIGLAGEVGAGGIGGVLQLGFEPDSSDLGLWLCHKITNRVEDDPKLGIVLFLQFIEASRKPLVR